MKSIDFRIKVGDTFELADIDLDQLEKHVSLEYVNFLDNPNDQRTEQQIYYDTYNGLAAERYMIEYHGYENDDRKYKDLFSPCRNSVEIKSAASLETMQKQLSSLKERKGWGLDIADYVVCFLRDNTSYTCHSLYMWNGKDYIEVNDDEPQEDRDDIIRKLESMPLEKARQTAIDLMESWNPKRIQGKASKNRVIFDIKKAFTSADICVIMYRLQLAQEGLATVNSKWKQHYRNV